MSDHMTDEQARARIARAIERENARSLMPVYTFTVQVKAPTKERAEQVMTERIEYDEDYGFPYEITDWSSADEQGCTSPRIVAVTYGTLD